MNFLNADENNDVAAIVRKHCDRIVFAHIRNVKHFGEDYRQKADVYALKYSVK